MQIRSTVYRAHGTRTLLPGQKRTTSKDTVGITFNGGARVTQHDLNRMIDYLVALEAHLRNPEDYTKPDDLI